VCSSDLIWEKCPKMQIIFCTAYSDYSWEEVIQTLGRTDRLYILKKPFDNIEVRQIVCSLNEKWMLLNNLDRMVAKRTQEIEEIRDITVFALARLAESRDPETGEHLERIRAYCQILAEQLRKNSSYSSQIDDKFMEDLYRSSPLHDIGKVGIPDCILLKPDSLTKAEFEIMKQHSVIGADSLEETTRITTSGSFLKMAADIARYHHERFNGSGYPYGLKSKEIPLAARIVALADVYDALTSIRVYKPAFSPEIAHTMILEERGEHFDPEIVDAYVEKRYEFLSVRNCCESMAISLCK
jgi:putative two-component system response regulator